MLGSGDKTQNLYSVLKQSSWVRKTSMGIIILIPGTCRKPRFTWLMYQGKLHKKVIVNV